MCIFYGTINAADINAWIIYQNTGCCQKRVKDRQRKFMSQLAIDLICPWAMQRLCIPTLQYHLRSIIKDIFDVKEPANSINRLQELPSRKRCRMCPQVLTTKPANNVTSVQGPYVDNMSIAFVNIAKTILHLLT